MPRIAERRRGFTLLEVLLSFAVGTVLIGVIYFFYLGIYQTGRKTEERVFLNQHAELVLERIVRELQLAVTITELDPDAITFQRPEISPWGEDGFEVNMDTTRKAFAKVSYRRHELDGGRVAFQRKMGMGSWEALFTVDHLDRNIFRAWVVPRGAEESPHEVPSMRLFRPGYDEHSWYERIPLVGLRFQMKNGRDSMEIVTKAFLPPVWAKIQQPAWNTGL